MRVILAHPYRIGGSWYLPRSRWSVREAWVFCAGASLLAWWAIVEFFPVFW